MLFAHEGMEFMLRVHNRKVDFKIPWTLKVPGTFI